VRAMRNSGPTVRLGSLDEARSSPPRRLRRRRRGWLDGAPPFWVMTAVVMSLGLLRRGRGLAGLLQRQGSRDRAWARGGVVRPHGAGEAGQRDARARGPAWWRGGTRAEARAEAWTRGGSRDSGAWSRRGEEVSTCARGGSGLPVSRRGRGATGPGTRICAACGVRARSSCRDVATR
jgi:hypothetical protein